MFVRRKRIILAAGFTSVLSLAALLFMPLSMKAQQPAAIGDAKKDVPDNLAEHTPPVQPIPYSHQTHLAIGLECATCHTNPEPGKLMTFPATSTCMSCHVTVATKKPSIQKLASFPNRDSRSRGCASTRSRRA